MRIIIAILTVFLSSSFVAAQNAKTKVTDVTYIVENGEHGLGIKVDLSKWVEMKQMSAMAQEICQTIAPQWIPEIEKRKDMETPTFVEVDAKVPRSLGIVNINVGQVRRFDYKNGKCQPRWSKE